MPLAGYTVADFLVRDKRKNEQHKMPTTTNFGHFFPPPFIAVVIVFPQNKGFMLNYENLIFILLKYITGPYYINQPTNQTTNRPTGLPLLLLLLLFCIPAAIHGCSLLKWLKLGNGLISIIKKK